MYASIHRKKSSKALVNNWEAQLQQYPQFSLKMSYRFAVATLSLLLCISQSNHKVGLVKYITTQNSNLLLSKPPVTPISTQTSTDNWTEKVSLSFPFY